MYILGIYNGHNANVTLLKDGKVIASVGEERFKGEKNYIGFPEKSIKWLLKEFKIRSRDLRAVVLPYNFGPPIYTSPETQKRFLISFLTQLYRLASVLRRLWGLIAYRFPYLRIFSRPVYLFLLKAVGKLTVGKEKEFIADFLKIRRDKVISFDHHLCHAAAAYFSSPFNQEKALVFTLDGEGDTFCASVNIAHGRTIRCLARTDNADSLGLVYLHLTQFFGMKPCEDEYKIMGLAPYAKTNGVEKVYNKIKDMVILDPRNPLTFKAKFDTHQTYRYLRREMEGFRFDNIAGAFQKLVEERTSEWVKTGIKKTGIKTVILSGGVFMNIKANQKIAGLKEVKKLFIMPSCGDESTPIGAVYLGYLEICRQQGIEPKIQAVKDLYLGPGYSNQDIGEFLKEGKYYQKYKIQKIENIEKTIARLLGQGKIIGCLSGRMEWGARALGNRSILANPSDPKIIRIINEQIKNRDFWMPFTPSILAERAKDYIINPKNIPAPYMVLAFDSTKLAREHLPAAMHPYDLTIRPQLVEKSWNPKYYKIIKEFEKLTGIGGVLNTSFNLHGFPIVLGPKEAMDAFENSGLKYLVLENYLIRKQ